jgi:hypothetical protein
LTSIGTHSFSTIRLRFSAIDRYSAAGYVYCTALEIYWTALFQAAPAGIDVKGTAPVDIYGKALCAGQSACTARSISAHSNSIPDCCRRFIRRLTAGRRDNVAQLLSTARRISAWHFGSHSS